MSEPRKYGRGRMKPAPMPVEELRALLAYDRVTGLLTWKCDRGGKDGKRIKAGATAGGLTPKGYIVVGLNGTTYPAQRLIWFIETGEWPDGQIDHRNEIKTENWWDNLRRATHGQNQTNRKSARPNTSGFRGVSRHYGNWKATISIDGRAVHLGTFDTPEAAHEAYVAAARAHQGEFARTS